eukprot:CAMPEP_0117030998 /NCGR_PEP_ID=MMETSP0472-20121206/22329_1 /TAXON_ID=693140 ORGANISM="Tiarina fusus, Strain LIS" /NCGR_SAMPLE_ID=MMETSP0472 /ASSEMBLY_ACC=CAM_ASM_000603 /LENGTH=179 /DNA_ID=CAMNT_0004739229 /DNA_START=10 /DNA_END=549 /DNA_ORIENTATION=-
MSRLRSRTTSSLDVRPAELEGFLLKRGGFIKNWKNRWFEVKDGIVRYYYSEEKKTKPIKSLYLGAASSCEVCSDTPAGAPSDFCFALKYGPHKRTYYCCASSKEEMHLWVARIQQYIEVNSPKNSKDWAKNFAKAIDHPNSSLANESDDRFPDDDSEELSDDVFQTHRMRLSVSPWTGK